MKCPVCGKAVAWNRTEGYSLYCSEECRQVDRKRLKELLEPSEKVEQELSSLLDAMETEKKL